VTVVALLGATASGKSAAALEVARALGDVEIVTVDSMQVYRGLDIGTAKPTPAERAEVPHHLLDLVEVEEEFSVAEFVDAARAALAGIEARGHHALLVGGTGLYLRALVDDLGLPGRFPEVRVELEADPDTASLHRRLGELDPVAAGRMEPSNRRRVVRALEVTIGSGRPFSSFGPGLDAYPPSPIAQVGIDVDLTELDATIGSRVDDMLATGLLAEARRLVGRRLSRTAAAALGYRELLEHLAGERTLEDARLETMRRTRRLARRQLRWFRRDPRITWSPRSAVAPVVMSTLRGRPPSRPDHAT
jgi:tRNA dimethylallyltransferase